MDAFPSMPRAEKNWSVENENAYVTDQLNYQPDDELRRFEQSSSLLNAEQRVAFDDIFSSVSARDGQTFFLHGPAGTGKTFLYHTLCHRCRANGWIVLCIASSGIASLLLPGGHTAHSTFSIPVETLNEDSCCQIDKNSQHADMLRMVRLIIWDEAVTQHRLVIVPLFCALSLFLRTGTWLKQSIVCFKMFDPQHARSAGFRSSLVATFNKHSLSSSMAADPTSCMQQYRNLCFGITSTCSIFEKICVSSLATTPKILPSGYLTSVTVAARRLFHPLRRFPYPIECVITMSES
jgi:hypothetical protein